MTSAQSRLRPQPLDCFRAIRTPQLYRNFAIHLFVMFPAAMIMCWLATKIDARLGWSALSGNETRWFLGSSLISIGGTWVWYVYGYLFLAGDGSPGTHVDGGPVRLVDTGPYTMVRHPSVLGKVLGVTGLGILWASPSFLTIILPILLLYSYITNKLIQEHNCHQRFGACYKEYCSTVPMFLPTPKGFKRWREQAPATTLGSLPAVEQPTGVWHEFKWYLAGLILLITIFALPSVA